MASNVHKRDLKMDLRSRSTWNRQTPKQSLCSQQYVECFA